MRVEVTEFKRCCFCVPMRYGLLAWAYIKLVARLLSFLVLFHLAILLIFLPRVVVLIFFILIMYLMADFGFTIVFVIGAHKKNYILIKIYYVFSLVGLGVVFGIYLMIVGCLIYAEAHQMRNPNHVVQNEIIKLTLGFIAEIFFEGYIILLIRSEALKLKRNFNFEFVNNEANAECRMDVSEEETANGQMEINPTLG